MIIRYLDSWGSPKPIILNPTPQKRRTLNYRRKMPEPFREKTNQLDVSVLA